jgi:hypothetical protein
MNSLREVFLSYHHNYRKVADRLKKELSQYGLSAFLAHEDLAVSSQWRREILRHLNTCVAVVAVVTRSFYKSDWTSQEVGIAMGKEKAIISLVVGEGIGPRGFMESFQYVRSSDNSLEDALRQVAKVLDAAKLSQKTREAYRNLAGILNLLLLTWKNRAGYRRNPVTISEIRYHFSIYSEQLSEALSLNKDAIDHRIGRSFRALIKMTNEYLRLDSADYRTLDKTGEKVFNRGTELMGWLRERIPKWWQKKYLDSN